MLQYKICALIGQKNTTTIMSNGLQKDCADKYTTGIDLNISFRGHVSMHTLVRGEVIRIHAFFTSNGVTPEN